MTTATDKATVASFRLPLRFGPDCIRQPRACMDGCWHNVNIDVQHDVGIGNAHVNYAVL